MLIYLLLSLFLIENSIFIGVEWEDTGVGCCTNPVSFLYNGQSTGFDDCKAKCVDNSNCGWINFFNNNHCSLIPKTSDCSNRDTGPTDCGSSGQNVHVHKYLPRHGNTFNTSI